MFSKAANRVETLFRTAAADLKQASRIARPNVKAGFIAAGVVAPVLLSNRDRDPGETALITTPVVGAAFVSAGAAGEVFKRAKQTAGVMFRNYSSFEGILRNNDVYALENILSQMPKEHRAVFSNLHTATKINFYGGKIKTAEERAAELADKTLKATKRTRDHIDYLRKNLSPDDARWKSVAASVREATVKSEVMDDVLQEQLNNTILPEGTNAREFVESTFARFVPEEGEINGKFTRAFASRLRQNRVATNNLTEAGNWAHIPKNEHLIFERPTDLPELWDWATTEGVSNVADVLRKTKDAKSAHLASLVENRWSAFRTLGYQQVKLHYDQENLRAIGMELIHTNSKSNIRFGIGNPETGQVFLGKGFTKPGVSSRIARMTKPGVVEHYDGAELALTFLGEKGVTPQSLQREINRVQVWHSSFGQSAAEAKVARYGENQTRNFSNSSVLSSLPIHHDGITDKDFSWEQKKDAVAARYAKGERPFGGTGGYSKSRMYTDTGHDLLPRLDKPTTMGLTQMKPWELFEAPGVESASVLEALEAKGDMLASRDLAEFYPKVLSQQTAEDIAKTGARNLFNMTIGSEHVSAFEYHGLAAEIAHRGNLPMTEKGWRQLFLQESSTAQAINSQKQKVDFKNKNVSEALDEFANQRIRKVMSGEGLSGEDLVHYNQQRARMEHVHRNAVRNGANARTVESDLFQTVTDRFSKKRSLIGTASDIGTAGGEGHYAIFKDRLNIPVVRYKQYELRELTQNLRDHMATENGKLRPDWKKYQRKGSFQIGLKNDAEFNNAFLGDAENYLITDIRSRGAGEDRVYQVTAGELHNVAEEGMKPSFGDKKMSGVPLNSQEAIPLFEDFNKSVGNAESAFMDGVHAIVRTDEMQKLYLGLPEMVNLSNTLLKESDYSGRTLSVESARGELQSFLANEIGVKDLGFTNIVNKGNLQAMAEKATGTTGDRALMEYGNVIRDRLFGKEGRMDYTKLAELAKLKSEELVERFGVMGQLELHMVNHGLARQSIQESTPLLRTFLQRDRLHAFQNRPGGRNRLSDFISENAMNFNAGMMEWQGEKMQRSVRPTEDLLRLMEQEGMHHHIADIKRDLRATGAGDPSQLGRVVNWMSKGRQELPEGSNVVSVENEISKILSRENTGTVLDWRRPDLKENFFYKLSSPIKFTEGEENFAISHVAHPGYSGLGGAPNRAKGLDVHPTEVNRAFEKIVRADAQLAQTGQGQEKIVSAYKEYEAALNTFVSGKRKNLRPALVHPTAFSGNLRHIVTGEGGMFETYISKNRWQEKIAQLPKDIRDMAEQYGYIYATPGRHPHSYMAYVRVRPHDRLGENDIGIGDELRQPHHADFDHDYGEFIPVQSREAWAEGHEAVSNSASRQWMKARERALYRLHEQNISITQDITDAASKGVGARALKNYAFEKQFVSLEKRLAGQFIGHFSHLTTQAQLASDSLLGSSLTPEFLSGYRAHVAAEEGFWNLRQMAIALQKHEGDSLGDPNKLIQRFNEAFSMRNEEGGKKLLSLVQEAAKFNKDEQETYWTKWHEESFAELGAKRGFKSGDKINLLEEVLHHDNAVKQRIVDVVANADESVPNAFRLLTSNAKTSEELFKSFVKNNPTATKAEAIESAARKLYQTMESVGKGKPKLATHLAGNGYAANKSASMLRTIVDSIKKVGKEGKAAIGPGGKVAMAGGLVAAGAGAFLMSDPEAMSGARAPRPSSRPEEAIGVSDQVPGAPETGMESGNPQRNVGYRQGPQRAMVSPMRRGTNLDVTMDAPDESVFRQIGHRLQSIGSGDAFVTNNHIGGWRDGANKLSTRDRLREDLNRY